ncbi:MAG: BF3164 family lipoprotein [Cyclobacterium sp.]|uniref:BF3164 family lipoprotein n=1 Tax=unclassified Cyclobacterium TaxID=2615055 RepID=UPI0013D4AB9D|nr:BF3164 family lipoprotein [Cyclobacterium sp. SYSU L10401]
MKKIVFLAGLFLFFISCQSKDSSKRILDEVPNAVGLESKELSLDNFPLLPSKLILLSEKAVIFNNAKKDLFKVYSLPSFDFLFSFGEIGEGPNEFSFVDPNSVQTLNENLVIFSGSQITKVKLENEKEKFTERIEVLEGSSSPINRLVLINDSIYVSDIWEATPGGEEHLLVNLVSNEEIDKFGRYPQDPSGDQLKPGERYRQYMKTLVSHPGNGRLATFYIYQNLIKYYSEDGELLQEIEVNSDYANDSDGDDFTYRVEPFATKEFIYVLHVGKTKKEAIEQPDAFRPHLEIWDWDGNLVERYLLDQPITTFAVSPKFEKLYGMSFFKEDVIFEYNLKNSKNLNLGDSEKNQIENDYYQIELPAGWNYATNIAEEKNVIREKNDFYINYGGFVRERTKDSSGCGASIQLWLSKPINEDFDISAYIESKFADFKSNSDLEELSVQQFSNSMGKGYILRYDTRSVDPKGRENHHKWERTIYEKEGIIIETSFGSCDLFERYYDEVQLAFASLNLKGELP